MDCDSNLIPAIGGDNNHGGRREGPKALQQVRRRGRKGSKRRSLEGERKKTAEAGVVVRKAFGFETTSLLLHWLCSWLELRAMFFCRDRSV